MKLTDMITHEPEVPDEGWPYSHVRVEDVFDTDNAECVVVRIHGHVHFLHRTTAFSLYEQLQEYFKGLSDAEKMLLTAGGFKLGDELR